MKQLLEFVPLVLFFLAYKLQGIYVATGVLMATTVVQMAVIYALDRKLALMHKVTLVLILLFGTMTLLLRDERFIKWKPTVLYIAMALTLAVALWGMKKNLLHILLGGQLKLAVSAGPSPPRRLRPWQAPQSWRTRRTSAS